MCSCAHKDIRHTSYLLQLVVLAQPAGGAPCFGYETKEPDVIGGYTYATDLVTNHRPIYITDKTGAVYHLQFDYKNYDQFICNGTRFDEDVRRLINEDRVHFLLGGLEKRHTKEPLVAHQANKVMLSCCVSGDSFFEQDYGNMYGMFVSNSKYTKQTLKAMVLKGISKVAIINMQDHPVAEAVCAQAVQDVASLQLIRPDLQLVHRSTYNVYNASSILGNPNWAMDLFARVTTSGAEGLLICDPDVDRMVNFTRASKTSRYYLKAMWIFAAPTFTSYINLLQVDADFILSTTQWHPGMTYADKYFGTATEFYKSYNTCMGVTPSYLGAGASATVYVLALAIQTAFAGCDLTMANGNVDQMMYNSSAISCPDSANTTGDTLIRNALSKTSVDTFFGPIEFNKLRRNIGFLPPVTQILGGHLDCVLPVDAATTSLVMPIPPPVLKRRWMETPVNVILVALAACLMAVLLILGIMCSLWQRLTSLVSLSQAVSVHKSAINVTLEPKAWTSQFESAVGEGMYRGTRVALIPAPELSTSTWQAKGALLAAFAPSSSLTRHTASATSGQSLDATNASPQASHDAATAMTRQPHETMYASLRSLRGSGSATSRQRQGSVDLPARRSQEVARVTSRLSQERTTPMALRLSRSTADSSADASSADVLITLQSPTTPQERKRAGWGDRRAAAKAAAALVWRAMRLQHPALSAVLGVVWEWPELPTPVLLRELCDLGSLASLLENNTVPLSIHVKCRIATQVASAVMYLHAQEPPIYVGRLSTDIILLDAHFNPRLELPLTTLHVQPGKPGFLGYGESPRSSVAPGNGADGTATDILHFGLVLCQLFGSSEHSGDVIMEPGESMRVSLGQIGQKKDESASALKQQVAQLLPTVAETYPNLAALIRRCVPEDSATPSNQACRSCRVSKDEPKSMPEAELPTSPRPSIALRVSKDHTAAPPPPFTSFEELCTALVSLLGRLSLDHQVIPGGGNKKGQPGSRPMTPKEAARAGAIHEEVSTVCHRTFSSGNAARRLSSETSSNDSALSEGQHGKRRNQDDLLYDMFPLKVARALQQGQEVQPERYEVVSIFFSDIVGYTDICGQLSPLEVMDLLNRLYTRFDTLTRQHNLFKVETIGDAYMAVANLRLPQPESHARLLAQFALAAIETANSVPVHPDMPELGNINIRVGLHSGPVVASVVGTLNRRYCLFGDTVNTANRMESNSERNRVHASKAFVDHLSRQWPAADITCRGQISIKGKGTMETYWVRPPSQ